MTRLATVVVVLAACSGAPREAPTVVANRDDRGAATPPAGSAWAARCTKAITAWRDAAAALEPELATVPVELTVEDGRETIDVSAFPPTWHLVMRAAVMRPARPSPQGPGWHRFATFELGSDHRIATRAEAGVEATIGLDGWEPGAADAAIATFESYVAVCFDAP